MATGERFSKLLRQELACRAVWPPVLTPIALGDYGLLDGADFRKLGNIADFGVTVAVEAGLPSSLNLASGDVRTCRLVGDVKVPAFEGLGDVAARLRVEFATSESFLLRCRRVERTQICNLGEIAARLGRARTADGRTWRSLAWKIVWQLYTGRDLLFLAARSVGTVVELSARADVLHQLDLGSMSAAVGLQTNRSLGVEILGDSGPIGFGLARIKLIGDGIKFFVADAEAEEDEAIERLDADAEAEPSESSERDEVDEPPADWDAIEAEETDPRDVPDGPLSFADEPIDTSTRERWLQSCLRRLVDPGLDVDGSLGPRSRRALRAYQRQTARLTVDGMLGPRTITALESATGSTCPGRDVLAPIELALAAPPTAVCAPLRPAATCGELRVHSVDHPDGAQHIVSSADDEVRFSYARRGDGFDVTRYQGGKSLAIDHAELGCSPGALRIFQANALKESRGLFGAVNTWDDQLVSWGVAQFAGRAGTLAALLAALREDPATRPAFTRYFVDNGLSVAHGPYHTRRTPAGEPHTGWHAVVETSAGPLTGDDAWSELRTRPRLIGALMLAGNDRSLQLGQVRFWLDHFLARAVQKVVVRGPRERRICEFITSEYGLALVARLYNWMPAHVQPWFLELRGELATRHPELDLGDPASWTQALEAEFLELLKDRRRRVKRGSYDTYALDLDRERGSYFGPTGPTQEKS